ncbi:hypothetical protein BD310DRAFT_264552 [Dichomitus squalens]|uniref:Uncharacterized protein n=1 Tax=Dichomitus squalens TaxID=114155 RepID=A0A4V2K6E9_9APHY|nr:hypothetical protein BD310DRAFT_264552 [Dichomitus squalens]
MLTKVPRVAGRRSAGASIVVLSACCQCIPYWCRHDGKNWVHKVQDPNALGAPWVAGSLQSLRRSTPAGTSILHFSTWYYRFVATFSYAYFHNHAVPAPSVLTCLRNQI